MENYLNNNTSKALDDLIEYVITSSDYQTCQRLKIEMKNDPQLMNNINRLRDIQKRYVKSNFSENIKVLMDEQLELLNHNKTYILYLYHLERVNDMLDTIKSELNTYFYKITNIL